MDMEELKEIYQSLWRLALELETESERYEGLSQDILQNSHPWFDELQNTLAPDAFEKYWGITKAQAGIKLKVNTKAMVIERDLLVNSLTNAAGKNLIRSLPPFIFLPQTEIEQRILTLLNILYEEFQTLTSGYKRAESPLQVHYLDLAEFKFYISLLGNAIHISKTGI
jgi:hypothetical protein